MRAYRAHCSEVCARAKLCASTLPFDLSNPLPGVRAARLHRILHQMLACAFSYVGRMPCMHAGLKLEQTMPPHLK